MPIVPAHSPGLLPDSPPTGHRHQIQRVVGVRRRYRELLGRELRVRSSSGNCQEKSGAVLLGGEVRRRQGQDRGAIRTKQIPGREFIETCCA